MSNLDKIEEFEQLTFKQWIAFATAAGGLDVVKGVMRGTMKIVVETIRCLTSLTSFKVTASERKVHDFFQTRKGLWLSDDFKRLILEASQKCLLRANEATLAYADLTNPANDAEIGVELPEGHVFTDVNVFLVFLAALIETQWLNETEGVLLNAGYRANIFYVESADTVFTVYVGWIVDGGKWCCDAYRPHANRGYAGDRAFSATDAATLVPAL